MAKYIEEQEILWRMNNAFDEQDTYLPIHFKEMVIDECNTSDVVERSDYQVICKKCNNLENRIEAQNENIKRLKEYQKIVETENKELHSKIDKAIEEFRKEIEENRINVIDYAEGEWLVKDFIYGAIERLKKKIGE